ncbi:MAG TPA: pentapeptide repeat-containing protein [Holophagaceae bacterium]|nr:pentapeptide repeat-containing protein [Holophagaceae bacterium]
MAELTREDVIEHVKNRVSLEFADLRGIDLRGIDFKKAKLSGADLSESRLAGTRFVDANLTKAKLVETDLTACNFTAANLSGANLQKAILVEANLADAKLIGTILRSADLTNAVMTHADLTGADLTRAKCANLDLREAVLTNSDLSQAFMRGTMLRGANLTGARIEGTVGLDPNLVLPREGTPAIALDIPGGGTPVRPTPNSAALGVITPGLDPNSLQLKKAPKLKGGKASKYHAELRRIPSVIFTPSGWIRGVFHVPVMHGFVEHLNLSGEFLKLTDVTLPYLKLELKFFGIRRSKALIILPDCDVRLLNLPVITADYAVHRVSFLMEGGTVTGSLAIEEDIRLSDYLTTHDNYVVLKNCRFGATDTKAEEESHFPYLLVNTACVIGASDERLKN